MEKSNAPQRTNPSEKIQRPNSERTPGKMQQRLFQNNTDISISKEQEIITFLQPDLNACN